MKFLTVSSALFLAVGGFWSQVLWETNAKSAEAQIELSESAQTSEQDVAEPDLAAIRKASENYVEAYNERNADKLAELWSERAVYDVPDSNEQLQGRAAIQQMFKELFAEKQNAKLNVTIDSIRLLTADVGIETGFAVVAGDDETSASRYTAIYVKEGGKWLLESIHDTNTELSEPEEAPLSALAWLVGEWVDKSDESTVETNVHWTANGKFLVSNFRLEAKGSVELTGTQVIGWDPIRQQIRSWVFDSDGGVLNGSWMPKGDNWVVESTGFLGDGRTASSIQVYERTEDNAFTWQSFGREVDGQRLPNIEPVRVLRK